MAITHYSSLDAGAPVLSGSVYNRVKQILLACLVNGYGSKPAAGWTIGHQSADGNGFSLGNGDGFINLVFTGSNDSFQVYLMETITNGATALAEGVNRRSAGWEEGSSSTERQTIYNAGGLTNATGAHWTLVADGKTVILSAGGGYTTADIGQAYQGFAFYFGRYINALGLTGAAEFVALGGASSSAIGYFTLGQFGTSLRNPFSGVIAQGSAPRYGARSATYAEGKISSRLKLVPSRLLPIRSALVCYGVGLNGSTGSMAYAGQLRGVISEPAVCGSLMSEVCMFFGLPNTWQSRVAAIALPDGGAWVPLFPSVQDGGGFISLDPADWS